MEYRTNQLRKDEFHSRVKDFAKIQGIELAVIEFELVTKSDKMISLLDDTFLNKLTDEQRKELSTFIE